MNASTVRTLISLFRIAAVMTAASGCVVPQTRLEEARSAIRVEQEAHRRTQEHLGEIARRLLVVQASLDARDKRVDELEHGLSETRLAKEQVESEQKFALELVQQLRDELGRTGGHLQEFAGEKQKLAVALDAAEAKAKRLQRCEDDSDDNAAIMRDLALLLHEPVSTGAIELSVTEGRAVLRVPATELGEVPEPTGLSALKAIARVTQLHPGARVRAGAHGVPSEEAAQRLRQLTDKLAADGLAAERVELEPAPAGESKGEATIVISVFVQS